MQEIPTVRGIEDPAMKPIKLTRLYGEDGIMERIEMETMDFLMKMMEKIVGTARMGMISGEIPEILLYKEHPYLLGWPLTATHETTLHMVIMAGNKDAVTMLLNVLKNADTTVDVRRILTKENDDGVTPIHLAATLDMDRACMDMARLCPDLVTQVRNKDGETLLFKAVREGKKELFFALELLLQRETSSILNTPCSSRSSYPLEWDVTHCRRSDGNNILHIAIYGEYFDLAYEIVHLYPMLVNYVNERGESPLHYLANKPSSFRSGTSFNLFDQVIYSYIFIESTETTEREFDKYKSDHGSDKPIECASQDHESDKPREHASDDQNLPETCISQIFTFIKRYASIIPKWSKKEPAKNDEENPGGRQEELSEEMKRLSFQKIYEVGVDLFKIVMKILLVILGIGLKIRTLEKIKRKHKHAYQLMNELIRRSVVWEYNQKNGMDPYISRPSSYSHASPSKAPAETFTDSIAPPKEPPLDDSSSSNAKEEETNKLDKATPVLVAAKNGITEMVKKILATFPVAVLDVDKDEKNIMLLAVEYRQSHIYEFMNTRKIMNDSVFRKVDKNGNSALHLAAKLSQRIRLSMPGAVPQLQWEIQWFKHVVHSANWDFFATYNNEGKTAQHVFTEEHTKLVKEAGKWMSSTSNSCSVIAALIAGISFNSVATVPGGPNQISGVPILFDKSPFQVFAFSSLVSFCCSVSSLIIFLTIISSRYREQDFERTLPAKLIIGLSSLFTAIVALLVSFGAGNFFVVDKELNYVAFAIYALTFFPIILYAIQHFPFYVDFVWATLAPQGIPKKQVFGQN